jgi:hypothetical protein
MWVFLFLSVALASQSTRVPDAVLECPSGATGRSFTFSDGGVSEWCLGANGLRHGPDRGYYSNGQLVSLGEFVDGSKDGAWVYYLNDGTVWRRDEWHEGALVSKWLNPKTMALSGDELEKLGAVGGGNDVGAIGPGSNESTRLHLAARVPRFLLRYPSGRRRARGPVSDGLRTDVWNFWYMSGALQKRVEFVSGELSGTYAEWYENGRPSVEGQYLSGEKVGVWRRWDAGGKIRRERHGK